MKYIIALLFLLVQSVNAQKYLSHQVKDGESLASITKMYNITNQELYEINPKAKTKLEPKMILILPNKIHTSSQTKVLTGYKEHKVKRKETLYSISKLYNVSIDEIKKSNRQLYSESLKKDAIINIPQYKNDASSTLNSSLAKYIVQPKDALWGVAQRHGITVEQLEILNPNISSVIKPGDELVVPNINNPTQSSPSTKNQAVNSIQNTKIAYYEVQPKENFYRLEKKLGLNQQQLETLNPELLNGGLKAGMVLKIPAENTTSEPSSLTKVASSPRKNNNSRLKRIALIMPYNLNKIVTDTTKSPKSVIMSNQMLSAVLDFHSGVLMALDSAKKRGISSELKVFDSEFSSTKIARILQENDFSNYDAVIGPLNQEGIEVLSNTLNNIDVPLVIPLTIPNKSYNNTFQTLINDAILENTIIKFFEKQSEGKNVFIIADRSRTAKANKLQAHFSNSKILYSKANSAGKDLYVSSLSEIRGHLKPGENIVFLETKNDSFASNVVSLLNGSKNSSTQITLVTTDKNSAFNDNVDNNHLSNLNFHYPSINKPLTLEESTNNFVLSYKNTYNVYPNRYAVRGFDLTLDILFRLDSDGDLFKSANSNNETEHLENKFNYKALPTGGYSNEACYIVKYEDLRIINAE